MGGDHHYEDAALGDGLDDRFGPKGGGIDVALIDPNGDPGGAQAIDERHDPLVVLAGITDKNLGTHGLGFKPGNNAERGWKIKGENLNQKFLATALGQAKGEPRRARSFFVGMNCKDTLSL